jgi:hypothetical protein
MNVGVNYSKSLPAFTFFRGKPCGDVISWEELVLVKPEADETYSVIILAYISPCFIWFKEVETNGFSPFNYGACCK